MIRKGCRSAYVYDYEGLMCTGPRTTQGGHIFKGEAYTVPVQDKDAAQPNAAPFSQAEASTTSSMSNYLPGTALAPTAPSPPAPCSAI